MKNVFSFSVLVFAFISFGNWNWFTSESGLFTVLTPGEFEETIETVETEVGELTYHTFAYQPAEKTDDNFLYMISYCDYPKGAMHSDSTALIQDFFDATVESSVFSVNGTLFYDSDITLGGYPGKLWRVDYGHFKATIKTKAYMVDRRYYAIQTVTFKDKSLNPSIDKFLDSFKFIVKDEQD